MSEENKKQNNFIIGIIDTYVKEISGNWVNIFMISLLVVAVGLIFLVWPEQALVFIAYIIGLMSIIIGVWIMGLAFKVKSIEKKYQNIKENLKTKFFD
jgi:uncharacterized membrane protein HdeD (DUF308 family)